MVCELHQSQNTWNMMKLFDNNIQSRDMLRTCWKLTLENVYGRLLRRCEVQTWDWSGLIQINPETAKTRENKKQSFQNYSGLVVKSLFFCFFRGFFFGFWPKVAKTSRKPKKTKFLELLDSGLVVKSLFFSFLMFSRGFFCFLTKSSKNLEKTKKTKNNKVSRTTLESGVVKSFFFVFSSFCCFRISYIGSWG